MGVAARASAAAFGLALLACAPDAPSRPDVVVIVLDTLRVDRTTLADPSLDTMPFLAEWAEGAVRFDDASSTSSWTAPSVGSLFTGVYPNQHGVDVGVWLFERLRRARPELRLKALPEDLETLPEMLRRHGYTTFGIADNPNISAREGFSRGFDRFASADYRGGAEVNGLLAEWLPAIRAADPAFVYLHYMDPHWPYHGHGEVPPPNPDRSLQRDEVARYDAELRYLDARLREAFQMLALSDDAIVVVVSDHGEELYERGTTMEHRQHGFQVYDELVRVLLLVRDPERAPQGARVDRPVSLVDVLPTLRALVGAEPDPQVAGRSLVPLYAEAEAGGAERPLFMLRREVADRDRQLTAVREGRWKYIRTEDGAEVAEQLYDLVTDPGEQRDVAIAEPERVSALRERWLEFERAAPRWYAEGVVHQPTAEEVERLRALGYADETEEPERSAP